MSDLFDDADSYDEMLNRGIRLSGEDKFFFINGRLDYLESVLSKPPHRVLDLGCGVGDASAMIARRFEGVRVVGVDVAEAAVARANKSHRSEAVSFTLVDYLADLEPFDLCYVNGAFHHIPPDQRSGVMRSVYESLRPGGVLAVFENNPWSIAARAVMRRIPFDADAVMVSARELKRLALEAGFSHVVSPRYLFVFPRALKALRRMERALSALPIGAQYGVLAIR